MGLIEENRFIPYSNIHGYASRNSNYPNIDYSQYANSVRAAALNANRPNTQAASTRIGKSV